jgi:hypothetical protein
VIAGVLGLVVGLLAGWGLLRPEPDPAQVLGDVRATLASAAGTLEVVEIEYAESVEGGEIVAGPEFEGARDALALSRRHYLDVRDAVLAISPESASAIDDAYDELEGLVEGRGPIDEVAELARELREMITGAIGA